MPPSFRDLSKGDREPIETRNDEHAILDFIVASSNQCVFWTDDKSRFLGCNSKTCELLGYSRDELLQMRVGDIDPMITPESHQALLRDLEKHGSITVQSQPQRKDGSFFTFEFDVKRLVIGDRVYICSIGHEIVLEKQVQHRVLKAIAVGSSLSEKLSLIVELAEKTRSEMIASVMLLDDSGLLRIGGEPKLPEEFVDAINGIQPGPNVGSCGTAVFTQTAVMVEDVNESPLWKSYLELAKASGIRACWSEPIFSSSNKVLGTLAMYFATPQVPTDYDKQLMKTFAYMSGIAIESDHKQLAIQKNEMRYRSLVQSHSATAWTTSPEGEFKTPQESWEAYTGQPWEEHQGTGWAKMLHPDDRPQLLEDWKKSLAAGVPHRASGRLWNHEHREHRFFEVFATPIIHNEKVVEYAGYTLDVHDQKVTENRRRRQQAVFALAQEAAQLGSWVWDFESDRVTLSTEFCRLHGLEEEIREIEFDTLMQTVFEDDQSAFSQSLQHLIEHGESAPLEYRIIRPDATERLVFGQFKLEKDSQGSTCGLIGTVLDVSDIRHTEQALQKSERKLRTITDSLPFMISYVGTDYRYQFINATYEFVFNRPQESFLGLHVRDVLGVGSFADIRQNFERAFEGNPTTCETRIEISSGVARTVEVRLVPDRNAKGQVTGVYCLIDDITERRTLEQEVLNISVEEQRRIGQDLHDGTGQELTGLGMIADTLLLALTRKEYAEKVIAKKLADGIKRTLNQLKALARGLNPVDISADGLRSALTEMSAHVQDLYGIKCMVQFDERVEISDNHNSTQIFRIAQESTTNAAKHANASKILIDVRLNAGQVVLSVTDDGDGFAPTSKSNRGMGLRTMKYRAGLIGAPLEILQPAQGGTMVRCRARSPVSSSGSADQTNDSNPSLTISGKNSAPLSGEDTFNRHETI